MVLTESAYDLVFQWYVTYLPLYMVALGVSALQIGLLASLFIVTQIVSTLLGGYAADRFGRKRTVIVTEMVCWGLPMLLYAFVPSPGVFVAGRLINGLVFVGLPAFQCLVIEGVPPRDRTAVFRLNQFLRAGASLCVPVAGLIVAGLGIVRQLTLREFGPAYQSYWSNVVGDEDRAAVYSISWALTALCNLPAGPLAGLLYGWQPRAPFVAGLVLNGVALALMLTMRHGLSETLERS